ncbi:hypothetical protein [Oceanobacillus sp. CAU 1775]
MLGFFRRWKRQRTINKVKAGDGHALKEYRFYHLLSRSLFYARLREEDGEIHTYAVDVNYFSEESKADLYRDGKHAATSKLPAIFPVPDGVIEVGVSTFGLTRMHYVTNEKTEHQLYPDSASTEGLRMRFDAKYPNISRFIGLLAVIILLTSIVVGLPQLLEVITSFPIIYENIGTFESPISLPNWLNSTLFTAGIIAALERALTLRNHWLIDMETTWWDSIG